MSTKKVNKYQDNDRARFCRETTYAAEYRQNNSKQNQKESKAIDDMVMSKYSNRVPKSTKSKSVDRTKHRKERVHRHSANEYALKYVLFARDLDKNGL